MDTPEAEVAIPEPEATEQQEEQKPQEDLKAKLEEASKRLQELENLHKQDTERITKLKKEQSNPQVEKIEKLAAQTEFNNKLHSIQLQEGSWSPEQIAQAKSQAHKEYQGKVAYIAYQGYASEMHDEIEQILEGIESTEAKSLKEDFNRARQSGETLEGHIRKAARLVKDSIKTPEPPKEVEAKEKKSMKVDTGSTIGAGSSDDDFMKRYSVGESDDHKRAKTIMAKRLRGG